MVSSYVAWMLEPSDLGPTASSIIARMDAVNIFDAENLEGRVDVARAVGSTATAMFIYDLAPGQSSSPYHYEYEEEWLLVVDGTIVVRAPDGAPTLTRADLVCFPSGPAGANTLTHRSQ